MINDGNLIWYEDGTLCSLSDVNGEAGQYHGFTGQINSAYEMLETDTYEYLVCLDSVRDETDDFTDVEMYEYVYQRKKAHHKEIYAELVIRRTDKHVTQ